MPSSSCVLLFMGPVDCEWLYDSRSYFFRTVNLPVACIFIYAALYELELWCFLKSDVVYSEKIARGLR